MCKLVCFSTEEPWARSSHTAHVHQVAQPHGMGHGNGAVLWSVIWLTSRTGCHRLNILLLCLCCFQGFSSHHCGRDRGSWAVSLTQHWLILICLNCSLIQVCELSMAHLYPETWGVIWGVLSWWRLGQMGTVSSMKSSGAWVFAVLVPIYEVTAVRGFVLCRLLKIIQSHYNYYCSC